MEECIHQYLQDTRDSWLLQPDGTYVRAVQAQGKQRGPVHSAQSALMARYGSKG